MNHLRDMDSRVATWKSFGLSLILQTAAACGSSAEGPLVLGSRDLCMKSLLDHDAPFSTLVCNVLKAASR